jgi:NAD(P)-dependent dehydrogenase (short-subunit alcohol dehydrogenase family)
MEAVDFEGRVVVLTGAGRGLGRAYAVELARRGAAVVVNDVAGEHAADVVAEIEAAGGTAVACDDSVAEEAGAQAIVGAALARFGAVDAVINNAGFMRNGYLEELAPADLDSVLAVHVRGTFLVTRAAWPVLRRRGGGRVVMTSSAGGLFAMQGESNYAAAKAGVYGLCKALAFEGREHGIGVNAVLPMATTRIEAQDPVPDYDRNYPPGLREALSPRRAVEAVVPLVAFLASRACAVTGEAFSAGFGRYARVFVGEAPGWVAPDALAVRAEDVLAHLDEIRDVDGFAVPGSIYDEVRFIAARLGVE